MEKHRGTYLHGDKCTCGKFRSDPVHFICDKQGHTWDWDNTCEGLARIIEPAGSDRLALRWLRTAQRRHRGPLAERRVSAHLHLGSLLIQAGHSCIYPGYLI